MKPYKKRQNLLQQIKKLNKRKHVLVLQMEKLIQQINLRQMKIVKLDKSPSELFCAEERD